MRTVTLLSSTVLVGVVHMDPQGPKMLGEFLEDLVPQWITVEVSEYALAFRRERGTELLEQLDEFRGGDGKLPGGLSGVAAQLQVPFEVAVAEQRGCPVHLVGDSEFSRHYLELFETEIMDHDNLSRLSRLDPMDLDAEAKRGGSSRQGA